MIVTRTPFRMSFFGGGTDMEHFFRQYGGAVLSTTLDKYCYVLTRRLPPFFDYRIELIYTKTERVTQIDDIEHPLIRHAMKMFDMHDIRLNYESDLPARSGLGTSSSFAVGILNTFHVLRGETVSKKTLADEAIYLERVLCNEAGGWQDQIAAAYGGLNRINFHTDGTYDVIPLNMSLERKNRLNDRLLMLFTGFTRLSSEMQKANAAGYAQNSGRLREMLALVDDAENVLVNPRADLDDFGRLLDQTWRLKRGTADSITTQSIDLLYEKGIKAGALGGKLLGAGGGGFLVFYVQPEKRKAVIEAMKGLMLVPFRFEDSGTTVIHKAPENEATREVERK